VPLTSIALIGDVNADGTPDAAAGRGFSSEVHVDFLDATGALVSYVTLASGTNGMPALDPFDLQFGASVCAVGDLNLDGTPDIAVGAPADDGPPAVSKPHSGAVWIVFLKPDGTALDALKIGSVESGYTGIAGYGGSFGSALASLGDLDGDGFPELAVGARDLNSGGPFFGGTWILFLGAGGSPKAAKLIKPDPDGDFGPSSSYFGESLAAVRDLDGDGVPELAACIAEKQPDGALWILRLRPDGSVKAAIANDGDGLGFKVGGGVASTGQTGAMGGQTGQWLVLGSLNGFVSVLVANDR